VGRLRCIGGVEGGVAPPVKVAQSLPKTMVRFGLLRRLLQELCSGLGAKWAFGGERRQNRRSPGFSAIVSPLPYCGSLVTSSRFLPLVVAAVVNLFVCCSLTELRATCRVEIPPAFDAFAETERRCSRDTVSTWKLVLLPQLKINFFPVAGLITQRLLEVCAS
jgi:hypothetical protein